MIYKTLIGGLSAAMLFLASSSHAMSLSEDEIEAVTEHVGGFIEFLEEESTYISFGVLDMELESTHDGGPERSEADGSVLYLNARSGGDYASLNWILGGGISDGELTDSETGDYFGIDVDYGFYAGIAVRLGFTMFDRVSVYGSIGWNYLNMDVKYDGDDDDDTGRDLLDLQTGFGIEARVGDEWRLGYSVLDMGDVQFDNNVDTDGDGYPDGTTTWDLKSTSIYLVKTW